MNSEVHGLYVRSFAEISSADLALVGGKNASLGEMYRELSAEGIRVPPGFAVTAAAYRRHLDHAGLWQPIAAALHNRVRHRLQDLQREAQRIRQMILEAPLPEDVETAIVEAYEGLGDPQTGDADVAVRSSATAEDLPEASFAGQQDSFLNVRGRSQVLRTVKQCFASLFNDRAISYREQRGFDHLKIALSVGIQRMVRSDLAAAGVMFTLDTETGFRDVVFINAAYGLGETVVQGAVNPDEIYVFKPTLLDGKRPILRKRVGSKEIKTVYDGRSGSGTRTVRVDARDRVKLVLDDDEILELARWACRIEQHYSRQRGQPTPMDIEWAKDGRSGDLYIVQARPETVHARKTPHQLEVFELDPKAKNRATVLASGRAVGDQIGQGTARVIHDVRDLGKLREGEVLVTEKTDPDWEPTMKRAAAIITERGGRTCHAAIVARELGIPAIVGAEDATENLKDGDDVTVSCAEGETGYVYAGLLPFKRHPVDMDTARPRRTKIMMNLANPGEAMRLAAIPNDGVGLARLEFIIAHEVKVHPMALLRPEEVQGDDARRAIKRLTQNYENKADYFVDKLAEGVAMLAAPFYPKDVIVRFSDFKTNEYAGLLGGLAFEPEEDNPMLGFRGASRYYHERYHDGFALECAAIRKVREEMGLVNVKVMIPFCRTPEEGRKVLAAMERHGLTRRRDGLEIYVMCEIPSNVLRAEEFAALFDGFSIGSNDLTQLTLGVDRDSGIVASLFDERDEAVVTLIRQIINVAHATGRKVGICGEAPSDYPDFAALLVDLGIDSMSLSPDAIMRTTRMVAELEMPRSAQPRRRPSSSLAREMQGSP